jgi:hypothetical protein
VLALLSLLKLEPLPQQMWRAQVYRQLNKLTLPILAQTLTSLARVSTQSQKAPPHLATLLNKTLAHS